jgi:phospholipid-binding lipoprotein MlaA
MTPSPAALGPISVLAVAMLAGCASMNAQNPEDPYEDFNRQMFAFNDGVDRAVFEPVAKGYRAVTNEPVRGGVRNFLGNLGEPVTFANEVLQGKIGNAAGTVGRFVINTTVGIAGIFNPASAIGIARTDEDFGQTLGAWGVGTGPYLVLPFLGSTNPRDLTGLGADIAMDPLNHAQFDGADAARIAVPAANGLAVREQVIETIESMRTQVDPYTTARRFYDRSRAAAIGNSEPEPRTIEQVPDFELDF